MKITFPVRKLKVYATLRRYSALPLRISRRHSIQFLSENVDIDRAQNFALNVVHCQNHSVLNLFHAQ